MPRHEVAITGIGLATPLGLSFESFGEGLFGAGACFQRLLTRHTAPIAAARVMEELQIPLSRAESRLADRHACLALEASTHALESAGLHAGHPARAHCGVFVGCGSGPTQSLDDIHASFHASGHLPGTTLLRCLPSGAAAAVAIRHGLRGSSHSCSSACASSTLAIGEALRAIRHGYLELALVGGAEAPFGDVTVKAWDALRVLAPPGDDPGRACRPFDSARSGLVLAEGAAFFVLERLDHAVDRGASIHAVLAGYGAAGDGHHWTEPRVEGQVRAMQAALADAGLAPHEIDAINAHGTGTLIGDRVEATSIATVFGAGAGAPWVHASKSLHGHALGASGAIELAAVIASLQRGRLPATRNLDNPDDLPVNLVAGESRPLPAGAAVLSNSFAFGGSNACLVVKGAPGPWPDLQHPPIRTLHEA